MAHLWSTIVEAPIPLDALSTYVGLVRSGTYTQAGLLELVTTLDLNTVEIVGIVGQTAAARSGVLSAAGRLSASSRGRRSAGR